MQSKRKYIFLSALILAMLLCAAGCKSSETDKIQTLETDFAVAVSNMKFDKAYECIAAYGDAPDKEQFVEDYQYIIDALEISSISISDIHTSVVAGTSYFAYTVTYKSEKIGDITFDCNPRIVLNGDKYYLQYDPEMILENYESGDKIKYITLPGQRGEIFTSDGTLIAQNTYADTVCISLVEAGHRYYSFQPCVYIKPERYRAGENKNSICLCRGEQLRCSFCKSVFAREHFRRA